MEARFPGEQSPFPERLLWTGHLPCEEQGQVNLDSTAGMLLQLVQASGGPTAPGAGQRHSGGRAAGAPAAELLFAASVIS